MPRFADISNLSSLMSPNSLNYMGLIVRSLKQVEEGGIYAIGPEYRDDWTLSRR